MSSNVLIAFGLTVFAGLSTGIGSLMALLSKKFSPRFLALSLGFSAGVMIYVSFVEILQMSKTALVQHYGIKTGNWLMVAAFFAGIGIIALIDKLIPAYENPHEMHEVAECGKGDYSCIDEDKLKRMGVFSALAIAIHNFPEGLATFMGALSDPKLGVSIAVAVAIHNIPEGISVSAPIYYATKSRKKAFWLSLLSGLAEPVGAFIGYFFLHKYLNNSSLGIVFAIVAGIMVYISFDELLPTAEEYGEHHVAIGGLIAGMALMAVSLLLFL
ncbi:zinc transporter ZupT [Spirochaetota bacterium]